MPEGTRKHHDHMTCTRHAYLQILPDLAILTSLSFCPQGACMITPCYRDFPSSLVCKATNCHLNWHHHHPLSKRQKVVLYKVIPNFPSEFLPECPQDSGKYMSPYFFSYAAAEPHPPQIYFGGGMINAKNYCCGHLIQVGYVCYVPNQAVHEADLVRAGFIFLSSSNPISPKCEGSSNIIFATK